MIDREFYEKQLAKWKREEAESRALAAMATDQQARDFYIRQADRAAAYVSDYESDLAK
jgi:mannose/cellobiose epimerase-like protein (N-acyl-D-glucosamine 2-epimerase family)